jgi:hypothetical protein
MSLSRQGRLDNLEFALKLFVRDIADNYYREVYFSPEGTEYEKILLTTWQETQDEGYLSKVAYNRFQLTGYGWLKGFELLGLMDSEEYRERLGRLSKAMKDRVKGRQEHVLVTSITLANETGLPLGFIRNVVDTGLMGRMFNRVDAEWSSYSDTQFAIRIPTNFGLEKL